MEINHSYRKDIDGLRAIAVLSVLLYHVDVSAFSGGYVGVDVFFVISGFLITQLIRKEVLESGRFSFVNFYLRRARRLLPGFLFTLALCLVVTFFLFPPPQMEKFSESLLYSMIGLANYHFWRESGYFDVDSIYKPLLHLWSLGVEEQFYLIWPLILVFLLLKTPRRFLPAWVFGLFSISLYLNFIFTDGSVFLLTKFFHTIAKWFEDGPASIFYLTPFRVFEFAIGALLVWVIEHRPKNMLLHEPLMLAGLVMTIFPMLTYTDATLFPSYNALLPCLGAAFLIYSGADSRYFGSLLRMPALVEIGKISYSLYLFHWPVVVFYKYYVFDFGLLSIFEQIAVVVISIFAARLMYLYIEQPFRKAKGQLQKVPTPVFIIGHGLVGFSIMILAVNAWNHGGWAWRMPGSLTRVEITDLDARRDLMIENGCSLLDLKSPNCHPDAPLQVLSLGDSHNYIGYNMFTGSFGQKEDINSVSFGAVNDCDFLMRDGELQTPDMDWGDGECERRARAFNSSDFSRNIDVLVVSSLYGFRNGRELPIMEHLKAQNSDLKVIIVGPYISVRPYLCADIINRFGSSDFCKDERFVSYFGNHVEQEEYYSQFMEYKPLYINTVDLLCPDGSLASCLTEIDGVPMFYDGDHLSLEFSLFLAKRMLEEYSTELQNIGFVL